MRLDVLRRLKLPASPPGFVLRAAWRYGLGVGIATVVLTAGGVDRVQTNGHALASTVLPTTVPCGTIATDLNDSHTATWSATKSPYPGTASPYNLPVSTTNNTDPTVTPCDAIVVPNDVTLKIDASQGPVKIFSHGAAIKVDGGHLLVLGKDEINSVLFDAEPDVASWSGITVDASDSTHAGNASLAFASIQHALYSITINSGATSTPDPTDLTKQLPYGLALVSSGIGPSYFDGIDATDTPVSVKGQAAGSPSRADGKFGTVNNIGSQGIKFNWGPSAPALPAPPLPAKALALNIDSVAFGSSVPFAETGCLPLQLPCSAGSIGNDAVLATFTSPNPPPVSISQSRFFRAGSFGIELNSPITPIIKDNNFDCNGTGSPKPKETCVGTGLKYSAIYLNMATVDLENSVTNNVGHEDGLDAIVVNGTIVYTPNVTQQLTWINATNDAKNDHPLGYLLDHDLDINSGTFVVPGGSVVKSKGTINLTGATLNASDSGSKVFTSLRDNINIQSCPSVFVQSCPAPLPAGEWGGINLVGSRTDATMRNATTGTINNASILYATTGVHIVNGNSLTISGINGPSFIGPTFADGVLAEGTPLAVSGTTFGCPTVCSGSSIGNHGILADFRNSGPPTTGLKIGGPNTADGNTFQGSVNEAIRAVGLAGQPVDIRNNAIQMAGATGSAGSAGIYLQGADNLTLQRNDVVGSGTGNLKYPAIWLDGVSHADFSGPISGNTGTGNGLNALAFHGDSKALTWQSIASSGRLGFIVDGNLLVAGDLTLKVNDYAPVLAGTITVQNGALTSTGATVTSLKENRQLSCGSVFVPLASGVCPATTPGDWGGLALDSSKANQVKDSFIRYAAIGISMSTPTGSRNLTLSNTSITNTAADGLTTRSPVSITGGAFTANGAHGIKIDLTGVAASTSQPLSISGTAISGSGQDGILAVGLAGQKVQIDGTSVDQAGAFGINLVDPGKDAGPYPGVYTVYPGQLTLTNNTITNTAATFPAIYLNGFFGAFAGVSGNKGASNGVNAIAFHGTVTDDLAWQTAIRTSDPTTKLGYVLDNTLTMTPPPPLPPSGPPQPPPPPPPAPPGTATKQTLTVKAGDIVKVGNGGVLKLQNVKFQADDTGTSSQKVFTSLTDDSMGVATCHSAVVSVCPVAAQPGDWGGIILTDGTANGALINATVRYASTGILITSRASSTSGSSVFGLVVSGTTIGPSAVDGINAVKTAISVTTSSISGGTHGISVDFSGVMPGTPLRLSGNRFASTSAEAILGQALARQPVWITDNRIQGAGTYGIRLLNPDQLVLRNNNVAASGGGPTAGTGRYPAIYLPAISADFTGNIRGNVGSGNGLDALVFDGKVTSDLTWITPSNTAATHALGYLLDGGVTLQGGNLMVGPGDVVKSLGGPITINGGAVTVKGAATLITSPTSSSAIFTSLKDNPSVPAANPPASQIDASDLAAVSCPSILVSVCNPGPGDWGGLVITSDAAGNRGTSDIKYGYINYANTGISLDSGPIPASPETVPTNFRLTVAHTTIANASKDGINSLDTPFSVTDSSEIQNVGANGIIASFFSPANCSSTVPTLGTCLRLHITGAHITSTGKDGIIANGLAEQPVIISGNVVTGAGAYGIRLVGADQLTLANNTVNTSGLAAKAYPAIYLNNVSGDFNTAITGNLGAGNGLNALVFHGTVTTNFTWLTPDATGVNPLGYMLDGGLTVNGNWLSNGGTVQVLTGVIKITGALTSNGTTYTSMKESVGPFACNTVFFPAPCPAPLLATDYWGGLTLGGSSTFTGGEIRFASTGLVASGALNLSGISIHDIAGTAVDTSGGTLALDCSSIHGNGTGVSAGASATITQSDIFSNTTYDLVAPAGATATNDWWGSPTGGNFGTTPPGVVSNKLGSQSPVATLSLTDDVLTATNAFAIGNMKLVADFSRKMTTDPAQPVVQFAHAGDPPPLHTLTGTWTTSQKWTSNLYPLNLGTATLGKNTLNVSGARSCVPDPTTNLMTTPAAQDFTAAITPTSLAVPASSATYGGTASLSATLTSGMAALANGKVDFALNVTAAGSQNTNNAGVAGVSGVSLAGINAGGHPNYVHATYGGDDTYSPSSGAGDLNVTAAPLTITADPNSKVYGAANPTFTVAYSGFVNGETSAVLGGTLTFGAPALSSPVGTYIGQIVPSGQTSTNYAITYVSGTMTVTRASLTITADGKTTLYGAVLPTLTATPTGLVSPDTLTSIGVTPVLGTTATSSSAVGNYPITASGPSTAANYSINYVSGTLQVNPAPTTVAGSALPEPSNLGATVTLSATVTSTGINPNNEGTVTFTEGATNFCTTPVLTGNGGSCTYNAFTTGNHTITATYNPSANFLTSSSTFPHQGN